MKKIILFLCCVILTGCASTTQFVPLANEKNLADGNVLINVHRKNEFVGGGRAVKVKDNDTVIGEVTPGKSLVWQRSPGKMVLKLVPSALAVSDQPPIEEDAVIGYIYNYLVYWSWEANSFVIKKQ